MSFIQQLFSFLQDNQLFFLIQHFMKGFVVIVTLWIYTFPPNESLIFLEPFSSSLPKTCGIISYHRGPTAARKLMTHSHFHMTLELLAKQTWSSFTKNTLHLLMDNGVHVLNTNTHTVNVCCSMYTHTPAGPISERTTPHREAGTSPTPAHHQRCSIIIHNRWMYTVPVLRRLEPQFLSSHGPKTLSSWPYICC